MIPQNGSQNPDRHPCSWAGYGESVLAEKPGLDCLQRTSLQSRSRCRQGSLGENCSCRGCPSLSVLCHSSFHLALQVKSSPLKTPVFQAIPFCKTPLAGEAMCESSRASMLALSKAALLLLQQPFLGRQFWSKMSVEQLNTQPCTYSTSERHLRSRNCLCRIRGNRNGLRFDWIH